MLTVVACIKDSPDHADVIVESDHQDSNKAYAELQGAEARRTALMAAAKDGIANPGVNSMPEVFPVDEKGNEITAPGKKLYRFRAKIGIVRAQD